MSEEQARYVVEGELTTPNEAREELRVAMRRLLDRLLEPEETMDAMDRLYREGLKRTLESNKDKRPEDFKHKITVLFRRAAVPGDVGRTAISAEIKIGAVGLGFAVEAPEFSRQANLPGFRVFAGASEEPDGREESEEVIQAAEDLVRASGLAKTGEIQRRLKMGYTRAARVLDVLEERGVVGPVREDGTRVVLTATT